MKNTTKIYVVGCLDKKGNFVKEKTLKHLNNKPYTYKEAKAFADFLTYNDELGTDYIIQENDKQLTLNF